MPNCPCCFQLDPLQINLCEFDHTLEICLLSFFWIASKYFCSLIRTTRIFFSAHLSSRMFSPIHPYSEWPALSLQVCVCEQDPLFNQKLNELMQIFVRFLIKCQKHPRSPKHSHAPFCKLMAHCAIQEPVHSALEQLMRVAFHRVIGIPYHAKHTTQTHFFAQCFRDKKDAGCSGGPKSSNSSAKTCHGGCVLGGCGGPSTRRPQFAYLHTLILLSLHLPQVHSQRHHALSPDLPHKHCSCHTCHARAPTLIFLTYILATPATPTSTQHFTYILATPATHRITYAHIFWRRLPRRTTDTKNENKTKKQNNNFHKVRSNASLEALPCSLHPLLLICTVQFFDLWNCCGSERHPPKNPKLRLQHTWFLESGFVTIFSRNQDIKNNNGGFAILKLL